MDLFQFQPILKRARWGGRRLGTALGKSIGPETDYAESWELSDCGADQSVVAGGPFDGWTLARLIAERPTELLGRHRTSQNFPLLVKFLDAHDRLSVQVHPNDEQARRMGVGCNGKTETWIILQADPGSRVYAGLKSSVDARTLAAHLAAGTVEECLHSFEAKPGDCIFIPAGTVHAIGEGLLLAEIQQPSNATFRLFDWGRVDSEGRPRPLHRAESMACIDFRRGPIAPTVPHIEGDGPNHVEELVRCEYFVVRRHRLSRPLQLPFDEQFRVLMPLSGVLEVRRGDDYRRLKLGKTLLVPAAATGVVVSPIGEAIVLETCLP